MGSRLRPFRYPKELLPITYEKLKRPYDGLRPRVVSEFALETFIRVAPENTSQNVSAPPRVNS